MGHTTKLDILRLSINLAYLALFGSAMAIAGYLSLIPLLIFLAAFVYGLLYDNQRIKIRPPDSKILFLAIFISVIVSLFRIDLENLFDRVLGVLLIIIAAKLISPKKQRDILQIYLLNLFLITSAALIRFGIEFGMLVLVETFISMTGLILIYGSLKQKEIHYSDLKFIFRFSGIISLALIPSTIILFIIIPRPTWTLFSWGNEGIGKTGFSNRVTPGDVEQIKIDRTPAFRVKWINGRRPARPLWRGIVYDTFREGGWEKNYSKRVAFPELQNKIMEYEVLLEPSGLRYLTALGLPVKVRIHRRKPTLITGHTIYTRRAIERRLLYQVWSSDNQFIPVDINPGEYLAIPLPYKSKILNIANRFSSHSTQITAQEIENYFRTQFRYSLEPGAVEGDPVIHFLTVSKEGHCEYFATAMVLMLRSLGIPARIVGGYSGGEWNELGQYYLVNQSDAHTWVEVFIRDKGWMTFDPTPGTGLTQTSQWIKEMAKLIDFLRYKWYYWVMQYNLEKQISLARKATSFLTSLKSKRGLESIGVKVPEKKWIILLAVIVILFVGYKTIRSYLNEKPKTAVQKFIRIFKNKGFQKKDGETIKEFIERIDNKSAILKDMTSQFIHCYHLQEYRGEKQEKRLNELVAQIQKELKSNARSTHLKPDPRPQP